MTEPTPEYDPALIPDVDINEGVSYEDEALQVIKEVGIVAAYQIWCGKSQISDTNRTESIMVSCPKPDHPDKIPSAWLNSEKDVWFCGACDEGGDILDIGAYKFNFPVPGYKQGKDFPRLIETLLVDLNIDPSTMIKTDEPQPETVKKTIKRFTHGEEENTDSESDSLVDEDTRELIMENTVKFYLDEDDFSFKAESELDWQPMAPSGSFLREWMWATDLSEAPTEYLWWLGMQAIGLACGRKLSFGQKHRPLYANMMLTLVGGTGVGKSFSIDLARAVLVEALPFDADDALSDGVRFLHRPGSGEALLEQFSWLPTGHHEHLGLKGFVQIEEMNDLMIAANRKGATLKETVIGLYDGQNLTHTTRASTTEVVDPFMSLATGAQPDALGGILDEQDVVGGFANRFMFIHGTRKPYIDWQNQPEIDLTGLADHLNRIKAWTGTGKHLEVDPGALNPLNDLLRSCDRYMMIHGDLFSRLKVHALKLLTVLTANRMEDAVTEETVEHVQSLISSLIPTMTEADSMIGKSKANYLINKIESVLAGFKAKNGQNPTRAQVANQLAKRYRQAQDKELFNKVFETLVRQGIVLEEQPTRDNMGPRRVIRYELASLK